MATPYDSQKFADMLAGIGEIVVQWNTLESILTLIVWQFTPDEKARLLTTHMGSSTLCDSARTLANDFTTEPTTGTILHFLEFFERMREYRNYYVHGARLSEDSEIQLVTFSARSRRCAHQLAITKKECNAVNSDLCRLFLFGTSLLLYLAKEREPEPLHPLLRARLPEKPPLPDRLQKPRQYLKSSEPQPQSQPHSA